MSEHPAESYGLMTDAIIRVEKLMSDAERRGDIRGADAWRAAHKKIEEARQALSEARTKQDWSRK